MRRAPPRASRAALAIRPDALRAPRAAASARGASRRRARASVGLREGALIAPRAALGVARDALVTPRASLAEARDSLAVPTDALSALGASEGTPGAPPRAPRASAERPRAAGSDPAAPVSFTTVGSDPAAPACLQRRLSPARPCVLADARDSTHHPGRRSVKNGRARAITRRLGGAVLVNTPRVGRRRRARSWGRARDGTQATRVRSEGLLERNVDRLTDARDPLHVFINDLPRGNVNADRLVEFCQPIRDPNGLSRRGVNGKGDANSICQALAFASICSPSFTPQGASTSARVQVDDVQLATVRLESYDSPTWAGK